MGLHPVIAQAYSPQGSASREVPAVFGLLSLPDALSRRKTLVTFIPVQAERGSRGAVAFTHLAVPYGTSEEYLRLVLPALIDGLRRGDRILFVAPEDNLDLVRAHLGADTSRIRCVESRDWYGHPARVLAEYVDYARRGGPSLFVGEPTWRSSRDAAEWARVEAIVNLVCAHLKGAALCVYRRPADDALRTHPRYLDMAGEHRSRVYVPPQRMNWDPPPFPAPPESARVMEFDLPTVRDMRSFVRTTATEAGLSDDAAGSLVLAAAEIAANAVEHGAGHGTVTIWTAGTDLVCEITNPDGGGIEVEFPGYIPPEQESPRGYGLWISRQLCDLMEVQTTGRESRIRLHMAMT
ncbi:anti-sigma factor RsbA family regulatory protein [Herbidospora cretacea]|uniref:anti-sigma factor RsbA family regulatory protein n=1 Tax=Herbidospora cretacea TaxID=28444 RepID=UPI0009DD6925|nr:anti-sigma factor RsbA family regulatory protein [Herbidospora cretacea]